MSSELETGGCLMFCLKRHKIPAHPGLISVKGKNITTNSTPPAGKGEPLFEIGRIVE